MKTMVRPSVSAFFLTPAGAPASTAGSWLRPAPEPVLPDAGNSNPVAAECAKPARYGSGPRIPPRSSALPATPSTAGLIAQCFRPTLQAALDLLQVLCAQAGLRPARPAFFRPCNPSASSCCAHPLTDCRCTPTPAPPRAAELPWPATAPPASAGAPLPESLAVPPPDFPWSGDSIAY